jgi:UDP-N-acetylmuramoylalanine--D-glutamate ligase
MRDVSGERTLHDAKDMRLRGRHNIENVMAAFAIGCAAGLPLESMSETVRAFPPVEHRLEFVATINGVEYYNDSKATNVDAAMKAVEAFADHAGKLILIMGGRGKGAPYLPLKPLLAHHARALIAIGEDAPRIHAELGDALTTERADTIADAVRRARALAQSGDVVLLAPACASFDMFDSYEHRGEVFKEEVRKTMTDERGTMN